MEKKLMPEEIADKVFELTEQFNQYVFDNPTILDSIPDRSVLVFLDADDPDFNKANVELAESFPQPADSRRVYVRMQKHVRIIEQVEWEAEILPSPEPT
jgi:hypothetical protein